MAHGMRMHKSSRGGVFGSGLLRPVRACVSVSLAGGATPGPEVPCHFEPHQQSVEARGSCVGQRWVLSAFSF